MPSLHSKNFFIPPVIAHRGASGYAPENTLAAFLKAKQLGARWVEFDVMAAADEMVVIHDETLDRTTNGTGLVQAHAFSELRRLDAGSWFAPGFAEQTISSLEEVIACLNELNLHANIEIKAPIAYEDHTVRSIINILESVWPAQLESPLISSFSYTILEKVRAGLPNSRLGFLMHVWENDWLQFCKKINCISVNFNEQLATRARVEAIKSQDYLVLCYTVNDVARAKQLYEWGVDAVFTDFPDKILAITTGSQNG